MYEAQISQLTQQTFNMESAAIATDNLRNTMATLEAMKVANKEIKKQYGKIDIDKIENMHYDMEELLEQANEIQETLGRSYAVPDELDEADLEAGQYDLAWVLLGCALTQGIRKYRTGSIGTGAGGGGPVVFGGLEQGSRLRGRGACRDRGTRLYVLLKRNAHSDIHLGTERARSDQDDRKLDFY
jgi:hypothetical protein